MRKVYADENVWMPVVEGLRRRGWEITSAIEEDTLGASDLEHLKYASDRGWVILTFDDDFLSLVDGMETQHPGVVFISQYGKDVGDLVRRIDGMLENNSNRDLDDEILFA
jgi:predicted nuclease of predicted toxin-antitoxin system